MNRGEFLFSVFSVVVNYFFSPLDAMNFFLSHLAAKKKLNATQNAAKKITIAKSGEKKFTTTENAVKINNSQRFTAFTAKTCKIREENCFFHRISPENSPFVPSIPS